MKKERQVYLRPAISIVAAAQAVMQDQSDIIHQRSLSSDDGDITVDGYGVDETVGIGLIQGNPSSARANHGKGLWDD